MGVSELKERAAFVGNHSPSNVAALFISQSVCNSNSPQLHVSTNFMSTSFLVTSVVVEPTPPCARSGFEYSWMVR